MFAAQHYRNTTAMIVLAAATLAAAPAFAEKASLNSISYNPADAVGAIHVISTDKQAWNALKTGSVWFDARMKVDTKHPGAVSEVAVTLGECSGGGSSCGTALWSDTVGARDYDHTATIGLHTSKIGVSGTGITLGDQIIAGCNAKLQADGPTKSHSFTHELPSTFIADTEKVWGNIDNYPIEANGSWPTYPNENDHHRTEMVKVQIICDAVVKPSVNDVAHDHGAFKVEDVKLFLTTYQNTQPGSNPGTVCPAFKVSTRAEASKAGAVSMRVWRQKNGGAITSQLVQAWASYNAAKNGYFATWQDFEQVGTTSYFQYKVEIEEQGPFAPTDGWKDITVHCTGAGGGGFADQPQDTHPDLPKPQASWTGEVIVADSAAAGKSCPRKGQVFFSVERAEPGNFDYRISCSNGAYFEGSATAYDQGSGVFEAYGAHDLSVNKTRSIQCTLQEMTPAPVTVAVDKTDFTCANPTVDPSADDLVDAPRPSTKKPDLAKPGKLVAPLPEPKKPSVSILCKPGFKLVGEKCVKKPVVAAACKSSETRIEGKCVKKPSVSILCKPGFKLVGKTCVKKPVIATACAKGEKLVRGNCVKKPSAKPAKLIAPKPGKKLTLPGAAKRKVKRAG
jgi:hypothetical protein